MTVRLGAAVARRGVLGLLVTLASMLLVPQVAAQPVEVGVDLHVLNIGNYDANKGTYTLDMYLVLRWDVASAPPAFVPDKYEFMNGRATSKELTYDATVNGTREMWWRIQANLYSSPYFREYP